MTLRASVAPIAALLLSACASTGGTPLAMTRPPSPARTAEFRPTGEVRSSLGKSASFDAWLVIGPSVNLAYAEDGAWIGSAGAIERGFRLAVKDGTLSGSGVNVSITREADGTVVIGGMYFQSRYLVRLASGKITGSTRGGKCSFELSAQGQGLYQGNLACGRSVDTFFIHLLGDAARTDDPVLPQVALALLAVLP
jgi:hypothetical protein